MVRISETSNISDYEKGKFKKEDDFLLIGKRDKSINVVSGGEKIDIKELPTQNRVLNTEGTLSIPSSDGVPFIIQYGTVYISANTTIEVPFVTPFSSRCFQVQVTQQENDAVTGIMAKQIDRTKFSLGITGGVDGEIVAWFAIGI